MVYVILFCLLYVSEGWKNTWRPYKFGFILSEASSGEFEVSFVGIYPRMLALWSEIK